MNDKLFSELDLLIEQLLEERISPEEVDRLNQLLKSPEAQEHYLNYIMLHGMLSWDAGLNCPFTKQSPENIHSCGQTVPIDHANTGTKSSLSLTANPTYNSIKRRPWVLIAGVLTIILGLTLFFNGHSSEQNVPPLVNQETQSTDNVPQLVHKSQESDATGKEKFPQIQLLPHNSTANDATNLTSAEHSPITPTSNNTENAWSAYSDQVMVSLINQQLSDSWQETGVSPSPRSDDGEWLRRVYLDLAGRIPTADETARFLKGNNSQKRREVVNKLLNSEQFSQQFAYRWSSLLVGRSREKQAERKALTQFLATSMQQEHTWSKMFQDLITAEGTLEENGATGFLLAHLNDMAVPATAVTCRLLLGEQLQCVQCHKHPHNDWTQEYFWEINSFFKQTKSISFQEQNHNHQKLVNEQLGGPTYYETANGLMKVAYPKLGSVKVNAEAATNRREEFARLLLTQKDQQIARAFVNRSWAMLFGYGFTNPIDDLGPHNPPSHPELFDQLSRGFVANEFNIRKLISWICLSDAYQLTTKLGTENSLDQPEKGEVPLFSRVYLKMMSPEQLYTSLLMLESNQVRTLPNSPGQEAWTEQFVIFAQNDENNEFDQFSGTVNQALELMNGDLMDEVVHNCCRQILNQTKPKGKWTDAQTLQIIIQLSRTFMTRDPSPREVVVFKKLLEQHQSANAKFANTREQALLLTMDDLAWAFLNSSEFILIH